MWLQFRAESQSSLNSKILVLSILRLTQYMLRNLSCGLECSLSWHHKLRHISSATSTKNSITNMFILGRLRLKCDGTGAENRFRLLAKRTSPFNSAGESVQPNAGSRVVRISARNRVYTIFRGSVKSTGYTLHWPVSPSLPLPWVTVFHHSSTVFCTLLIDTFDVQLTVQCDKS